MKSFFYIMMFLLLPLTVFSQDETVSDPVPYFTALIVSNIETSLTWYTENLGYEMVSRVDLEERGLRMANLKSDKGWIELIEMSKAVSVDELQEKTAKKIRMIGIFKFGFLVNNLDQWMNQLKASGVEFNGDIVKDPQTGMRMIIVKDPDGNRVQLFEEKL